MYWNPVNVSDTVSNSKMDTLEQMIEDTIKNNVFLVRDMPYCALCKSRGVWTDDGPVLEYHTPECLVTRYKEYLNAA